MCVSCVICHVTYPVMSCHVMHVLCRVVSSYVVSCRVMSCHVVSCRVCRVVYRVSCRWYTLITSLFSFVSPFVSLQDLYFVCAPKAPRWLYEARCFKFSWFGRKWKSRKNRSYRGYIRGGKNRTHTLFSSLLSLTLSPLSSSPSASSSLFSPLSLLSSLLSFHYIFLMWFLHRRKKSISRSVHLVTASTH